MQNQQSEEDKTQKSSENTGLKFGIFGLKTAKEEERRTENIQNQIIGRHERERRRRWKMRSCKRGRCEAFDSIPGCTAQP